MEQVDEVWGFIPVIYIKESHILRERVSSLVKVGWQEIQDKPLIKVRLIDEE